MQKLETINTKQIVTESVETKKVITESVARRVVKESADPVFTSSIARGLVEEFGYEVEESTLTENPHASDPAKSAAWAALSPEDQKWLGGADPTDPAILARAPNKGKPAAPGAGTKPAAPAAPAAPIGTTAQGDDAGNTMITKPDGTVQVVGPDGNVIPPGGGKEQPATKPAADQQTIDPAKLARFKELLAKAATPAPAAPAKPTQVAPAPKKPATGAGTKPSQALPGTTGVPGAQISDTPAAESVSFEDDKTLLAIKNIRY